LSRAKASREPADLEAEDIADAIIYIVTWPRHGAVNEMLIRPTEQER
jgi:NADP-dependent 3-hydroxy acid dehydrogenase YdfG